MEDRRGIDNQHSRSVSLEAKMQAIIARIFYWSLIVVDPRLEGLNCGEQPPD
jgi:hypothetical protein